MKLRIPRVYLLIFILIFIPLIQACNMPGKKTPTPSGASAIYTAAAQTVQAQLTQISQPLPATLAPALPGAPTLNPAATALPTSSGATATAQPAATAIPCDQVKFIGDISVSDDTEFDPGESFVKTWRLQNAGSCIWTAGYSLVPEGDNLLGVATPVQITSGTVPPGASIDISINLTAPTLAGTYRQNFKLSNASGQRFGLGNGASPFWAQIKVVAPAGLTLDFISRAAEAEWRSGKAKEINTLLVFNGSEDDANGVAKIKDGALLETGAVSGKVLLTFPKHDSSGAIAGTFPTYQVQPGDRLRGRFGFLANPDGTCGFGRVTFQIYVIDGSSTRLLSEWTKTCDGRLLPFDISLSSLAGKTVNFVLVARAGTSFQDDWAIWNSVRIER